MLPEEGTLDEPVPPQYSTFPLTGVVTQLEAMYSTFWGLFGSGLGNGNIWRLQHQVTTLIPVQTRTM